MAGGFANPEDMFLAWQTQRQIRWDATQARQAQECQLTARHSAYEGKATPAPPLTETSQAPRQWNMVTLKRCTVTPHEYRYYGSVETVLEKKGFPTTAPEDGTILLSWFDPKASVAYYELARMQDQGELTAYMLEHFKPREEEGVERTIAFE